MKKVIYIDEETHRKLKALAAVRAVTLEKVVKQILSDYLKVSAKQNL